MCVASNLYQAILDEACRNLSKEIEWIDRYRGYLDKIHICQGAPLFKQKTKGMEGLGNLSLYLPVSTIKQANAKSAYLDLRYCGISVAELKIQARGMQISINHQHSALFDGYANLPWPSGQQPKGYISWDDEDAKLFRAFFENSPGRAGGAGTKHQYTEQNFESQLLGQFAMRTSTGKLLPWIQPVCMLGYRFQMPTPFMASGIKNAMKGSQFDASAVEYSGPDGGGIDILARQGRGKGVCLTVIELKDECTRQEPPEVAIAQAIVYASFMHALLREPQAGLEDYTWWEFFGFSRPIPDKLKLRAVIAMPFGQDNSQDLAKVSLTFPYSQDTLDLHYLYFNCDGVTKTITGPIETSLP